MSLRISWTLFIVLALFPFPAHAQFGRLKKVLDKASEKAKQFSDIQITEEEEVALGAAVSERVRLIYGVQQDEEATRYVTLVGRVVAEKSSRPELNYQFILLDSDTINAFATPGGFIHITRGALALLESEAELAGVIGHEIAHVTEKHTIKELQKLKGLEVAESETSLQPGSALFDMVVEKATEAILKGFGRAEELEADRVGVRLATQCRYAPSGLVNFLEGLKAQFQGASSRAGLFASHPDTDERIEKLNQQIASETLADGNDILLADRYTTFISYQPGDAPDESVAVEGMKGVAQTGPKKSEDAGDATGESEEKEEEKEGKSRFSLASLANPTGRGAKQQNAEVTAAGGTRGVAPPEEGETEPGNPEPVMVEVSTEDVAQFKAEGNLG